ncbi:MAG TPA: GNAT family N-acetyltransferase [Candidatus Methylacidiphilales bacterium]
MPDRQLSPKEKIMHQLAPQVSYASIQHKPIRKEVLEEQDLQAVADLVWHGIRDGFYRDIIGVRSRAEVLEFLRGVATRCEFRRYDRASRRTRTVVAALWVYAVQGVAVGFAILSETIAEPAKRGIELLMFGVMTRHRGLGYGASILDNVIKKVSEQYFNLVVRCPEDNQVLLLMLVTRGFISLDRHCHGRVLRLTPLLNVRRSSGILSPSTYPE